MAKYIGKTGERLGHADDEITIMADSPGEAMKDLLGYAADQWPESDERYEAVVWIEDAAGNVLAVEEVEILENGERMLDPPR